jgi:general secretion pathway protein J
MRQSARGFTLIELLVAVAVFALLAAAGVAMLAYAADNQRLLGDRMERLAQFQRARALLQADLAQAAVRRVRGADGTAARSAFVGNRVRASGNQAGPLFALARRGWSNPDMTARPSLQYVEYRLVEGRLERSVRSALDGAAPGEPQLLLDGVRALSVDYMSVGQWSDGWDGGANDLPHALRMDLQIDGIGPMSWWFLLPGSKP